MSNAVITSGKSEWEAEEEQNLLPEATGIWSASAPEIEPDEDEWKFDIAISIEEQFNELADEWESFSDGVASVRQKQQHQAYHQILSFGEQAIPLALERLCSGHPSWHIILSALASQKNPPTFSRDDGSVETLERTWREWAFANGFGIP